MPKKNASAITTTPTDELNVFWLPIDEAIARKDPENTRDHDPEGDIPKIVDSLLEFGWLQVITVQADGLVVGGHGRIDACDFLRKQSDEWFEMRWEKWLAKEDRVAIAKEHKPRFQASYWQFVKAIGVNLSEQAQKTASIRLNNTAFDGKDNPAKVAARLASIKNRDMIEDAAWDKNSADAFTAAFLKKKNDRVVKEEAEVQAIVRGENIEQSDVSRQVFERPDATVYHRDDSPDDAEFGSGEVNSYYSGDDDYGYEEDVAIASVEEIAENFKAQNVNYDTNIAETRAVLLMSNQQLEEYKSLVALVADRLNIEERDTMSIKLWRPIAVIRALRWVAEKTGGIPDTPKPRPLIDVLSETIDE